VVGTLLAEEHRHPELLALASVWPSLARQSPVVRGSG
jgi:hypothetical protein